MNEISKKYLAEKSYICLAPGRNKKQFFYTLYIEIKDSSKAPDPQKLIVELDNELMLNYHYKHCRKMHQLGHPGVVFLDAEDVLKNQKLRYGKIISSTKKFNYLETVLINPDELD